MHRSIANANYQLANRLPKNYLRPAFAIEWHPFYAKRI